MSNENATSLAIDVGGTKVELAQIDTAGKIVGESHKFLVPFDSHGVAEVDRMIELILPFTQPATSTASKPLGICVGIGGIANDATGEVVIGPNLGWRNLPLGPIMKKAYNLPVHVSADGKLAAVAEHVWGAARKTSHFAWITIGTGYGGYFYLDGQLHGGSHGFAGNFGHATLDERNGALCGCGKRGCFETYVAGPAIARQGQAAADSGRSPAIVLLAAGKPITPRNVIVASEAGDPAAREIIDRVIRLVCISLSGINNLLDLEMFVLGGGIVHAIPNFVSQIQDNIRKYLMTEEAKKNLMIVEESFSNAALYGAAANFFIVEKIIDS